MTRCSPIHCRLLVLLIPIAAGCYVYDPAIGSRPLHGQQVRLTLTDSGTANLAAQVGPSTEALAGRLIDDSAGNYLVSILSTRQRSGVETGWNGERVAVARPLVARIEERRFSRKRTILMTVALAAGAFAVREAFWGPGGATGGAPPGPGPVPR